MFFSGNFFKYKFIESSHLPFPSHGVGNVSNILPFKYFARSKSEAEFPIITKLSGESFIFDKILIVLCFHRVSSSFGVSTQPSLFMSMFP